MFIEDTKNLTEYQPHHFCTEASTLGLRPGQWPEKIETKIGNGQPFYIISKKSTDGDIEYATYRQDCGCVVLRVFND